MRTKAIEGAERQRTAALHGCCQCQSRRQDRIGQQRGAAKRRRKENPPAAITDQSIQGKMTALALVIGPKQEKDAFHRRQKQE